jgi:hypothetical protein
MNPLTYNPTGYCIVCDDAEKQGGYDVKIPICKECRIVLLRALLLDKDTVAEYKKTYGGKKK